MISKQHGPEGHHLTLHAIRSRVQPGSFPLFLVASLFLYVLNGVAFELPGRAILGRIVVAGAEREQAAAGQRRRRLQDSRRDGTLTMTAGGGERPPARDEDRGNHTGWPPREGSRHPGGIVSIARAAGYVSTIRYARTASGTRLRSQGRRTVASVPSAAVVRVTVKP